MREWIACLMLCAPFLCRPLEAQAKSPAEDVVVQMLGQLEKMAGVLASMTDEESAAAAREELKKHVASYRELRARAQKLPPPSREVKDRLAKEYRKKFVAVQEKLMLQIARVRAGVPGGREALTEVRSLLRGSDFKKAPMEKKTDAEKK